MNDDNYTPIQEDIETESIESSPLASRWSRLFASILDAMAIMAITIPAMYFTGGFDGVANSRQPSFGYSFGIGVLGILAFILFNIKFLVKDGQTIGKKALEIKIVDINGNLPSLKNHLLKRYSAYFLPGQVPVAGQIFSIINILLIFGKQKRCIHDHIAGTKVIKCE